MIGYKVIINLQLVHQ